MVDGESSGGFMLPDDGADRDWRLCWQFVAERIDER